MESSVKWALCIVLELSQRDGPHDGIGIFSLSLQLFPLLCRVTVFEVFSILSFPVPQSLWVLFLADLLSLSPSIFSLAVFIFHCPPPPHSSLSYTYAVPRFICAYQFSFHLYILCTRSPSFTLHLILPFLSLPIFHTMPIVSNLFFATLFLLQQGSQTTQ